MIEFIGKDPDSADGDCAAVAVDHATGDLLLNAEFASADDREVLGSFTAIGDHEGTIRMPARMRDLLERALRASPPAH